MVKEKLKSILNKIKNNKKKVIGVTIGVFAAFIFTFAVYNLNNPTKFNRLFASIGVFPNENFNDTNFYSCVVDAYNSANGTSKAYTDNLTDDELSSIKKINCYSKNIEDTKGIEKLNGLTELSLDNNLFTNIDLTNNTLLEKLSIINEKVDNQLANIDISNNTLLKDLDLSYNSLSTIDLSQNTNLTGLNLHENKLSDIDLSNNTSLTTLDLSDNQLTNIDVSVNTSLTNVRLYSNQLASIDLSNNTSLTTLDLESNQLTSINGMENLTELTELNLGYNQLTELNLNNNTKLTNLNLSDNQLTSIDLSNNTNLSYLSIDGTSLIEDILIQNGETYTIEEKIILPEGQSFTYSIGDTSIATIEGNTITAKSEGSTRLATTFGKVSFDRKLAVGKVELTTQDNELKINNDEKYIYLNHYDPATLNDLSNEINSNFGNVRFENNIAVVASGNKIVAEYKLIYLEQAINATNDYILLSMSVDCLDYINAVNCTYELLNDGNEIVVKYNDSEIDRKKIIYLYVPYRFKGITEGIYTSTFAFDESMINNIDNINSIDKNKINILNGTMKKKDSGEYGIYITDTELFSFYNLISVNSKQYNMYKKYIYLGTGEFINDLSICSLDDCVSNELLEFYGLLKINSDSIYVNKNNFIIDSWDLIKVSSDKYDMSGDTINLGNEDIDLTKINVTNATLKKEDNKLLVTYGDEVVKEFKLEGGKKTTTTTKKNDEKATTTKDKTTTKKEAKTTTTKKKVSIIDKIFGNKETTTAKKEETTTKKNIFRKSTTTKVENSSGNVTSNNKNSFKKLVTGSNLLILFLSITGIALIIYIIIDKKKNKEA